MPQGCTVACGNEEIGCPVVELISTMESIIKREGPDELELKSYFKYDTDKRK